MRKFNDWLGDKLSYLLSTMAMFYGVCFLVIAPLFFQRPDSLVAWMQYIISVFFQGVALPVLGYTAQKSGEVQAKILQETHDAVMAEFDIVKAEQEEAATERANIIDEQATAKEERDELQEILADIKLMSVKIFKQGE